MTGAWVVSAACGNAIKLKFTECNGILSTTQGVEMDSQLYARRRRLLAGDELGKSGYGLS